MNKANKSPLLDALTDKALQIYDTQPPTYQLLPYSDKVFTYDECDAVFDALYGLDGFAPKAGPSPEEQLLISSTVKVVMRRLKARNQ